MTHDVYCVKLKKQKPGLTEPPCTGEFGQAVYEHISEEAWNLWLTEQTKLINEYRLNMVTPASREFIAEQRKKFLFEDMTPNTVITES